MMGKTKMGREKDEYVTEHYEQTDDLFICRYCGIRLKEKHLLTLLKDHLLGEKNRGVRSCEQVPERVKAAVQAGNSNKRCRMNNEMPNPPSFSSSAQNNRLVQKQAGLQQDRSCKISLESSNPEQMPKKLRTPENRAIPLLTSELLGEAYKRKLEEIWSNLMDKNVFKIGIYGMAGAGKTELARHIYNRLLEHSGYDFFCWITMSPDFSILKMQSIIANAINFDVLNKDVEVIRAELSRRLVEKKFVIILDDVWRSDFSIHDAGITDENLNASKLILTTRSLQVCRIMNCQRNVFVDCYKNKFVDHGDWNIFKKELGKEVNLSEEIEEVAKSIVRCCGGLPLAIKAMARSMRGVGDPCEWRNALEGMKSSKISEPFVEVFHRLKQSYDNLTDQSLQRCFLYCALFDYDVDREDLIEHLIVEGIIEATGSRRVKLDRGRSLLNKLENVSLLEGDSDNVSMNGLIRKMSFQIMKENLPSEVEFGEEIKYLFMKDMMRISFIVQKEKFDHAATCPNVSTLLVMEDLDDSDTLVCIEDCFTNHFQRLKVLNFSYLGIKKLPKSVGGLKNLKALFLKKCDLLDDIPSLAELASLEVLNLCGCAVKELPEGVELLSKLRVLNLLETNIKELRGGILKGLLRLEYLAFDKPSNRELAEEIAGLTKLESLIWCFSDIDVFYSFFNKKQSPFLYAYSLYVGNYNCYYNCINEEEFEAEPRSKKVSLFKYSIVRKSVIRIDAEIMRLESVTIEKGLRDLFGREREDVVATIADIFTFSNLKIFRIEECNTLTKLFPIGLLSNLKNLEELLVRYCSAMEEIISAPDVEPSYSYSASSSNLSLPFSLPKLHTLWLDNLPKLKSFCGAQMKCDSLIEIQIQECENLSEIRISLPLPSLKYLIVGKTWRESVKWGDPQQKDALLVHP